MTRHIPSIVLGVYATLIMAFGRFEVAAFVLLLASAVVIFDRMMISNADSEDLWKSIRDLQTLIYQVHRTAEDLKLENQHILNTTKQQIESLKSEVKERIGSLAGDVSKVQQSNDPWSNNP